MNIAKAIKRSAPPAGRGEWSRGKPRSALRLAMERMKKGEWVYATDLMPSWKDASIRVQQVRAHQMSAQAGCRIRSYTHDGRLVIVKGGAR